MFKVSVPGSVMLMGEHAVLHGYPAIVAAINRRITVTLTPRDDQVVHIDAEDFGALVIPRFDHGIQEKTAWLPDSSGSSGRQQAGQQDRVQTGSGLTDSQNHKKFRYVIAAIKQFQNKISSGFDLHITSDFSDKLGLGSSAGVTVAVLAALCKWLAGKIDLAKIYELGVKVVHAVQNGLGSGADIAASVYGGVVAYQLKPLKIEQLHSFPEIALIYTGYKTPTVEVIKKVNKAAKNAPNYFENLYQLIGDLVLKGMKCFKQQDWQQLGQLFLQHFDLQRSLGVSDAEIEKIVNKLNNMPHVYGAKISGAGLGDCVLALGKVDDNEMQLINVEVDQQGIICSQ